MQMFCKSTYILKKYIFVPKPLVLCVECFYKNKLKIKMIFVVEYNNLYNNLDKMMFQYREGLLLENLQ